MTISVVIEHAILHGVDDDMAVQQIATVYVDGNHFTVVAPAKLRGEALKFIDHFSVREPSRDALDFGGEFLVTDRRKDVILEAIKEELKRRKRDDGRVLGRTPDGLHYDACICLHGHVLTSSGDHPFTPGEHCGKCGSAVIDECPNCHEPIRGMRVDTSVVYYKPPSYCHGCGRALPWMQEKLATAKDLLDHDTKLNLDDRERLWNLLQYVMSDPKSDVTQGKKKLIEIDLAKAMDGTKDFIQGLMAKTIVEAAKG
jgi:hypothetical protein